MATTYKSGKVDVTLYYADGDGVTIPAHYLAGDGVETTIKEGSRDISTMAGKFTVPSGMLDEANSKFTVLLPSMDYLKNIFPDLNTASIDRPLVASRTVFGSDVCEGRLSAKMVVHYSCDENSDDDVYIPNAQISYNATIKQNDKDPLSVEVMAYALPSDELNGGVAAYGTGSLAEPTMFDLATGEYEPITS